VVKRGNRANGDIVFIDEIHTQAQVAAVKVLWMRQTF
jgi:Holliday junction resolvasome RuvABC ATP-dependent DNA helicase subunit